MTNLDIAKELWKIIDDIDTLSDQIKPVDEEGYKAFYDAVMKKVLKRHRFLHSDGYKLYRIGDLSDR